MIGSLRALVTAFQEMMALWREQVVWMRETINRQQDQMIEMRRDGFQYFAHHPTPDRSVGPELPPQVDAAIRERMNEREILDAQLWAAGELMQGRDPEAVVDEIYKGLPMEPFD